MDTTATPPIVDAHVHIFPPEIAGSREAHCERDVWFGELYANPQALLASADELVASMDAAGINTSIACGFPWRDLGLCRAHNDYLSASAARFPGRIAWTATVPPDDPGAWFEAERVLALGAAGLGELNADAQRFALDTPAPFAPLADLLQAHDRPLLLHVSEPVGHVYPGKGTSTPDKLLRFLAAFPALRVVAAHWGGGLPFYELMPEVASLARNLVYDSAASTYLYRFQVFRSAVEIVGDDRILLGSDYPILRQDRFLGRARAAIPALSQPAILGGNAVRVFRLGQEGGE